MKLKERTIHITAILFLILLNTGMLFSICSFAYEKTTNSDKVIINSDKNHNMLNLNKTNKTIMYSGLLIKIFRFVSVVLFILLLPLMILSIRVLKNKASEKT